MTWAAGSGPAVARCHRSVPGRRHRPGDPLARLEPHGRGRGSSERLAERLVRGAVVEGEVVGERDPEQRLTGLRLVAGPLHEGERAPVELDRLLVCVGRPGCVARLEQVLDRAGRLVRLGEVAGQESVHLLRRVAVELHECLADPQMELAPARLDERPVRDLLHEAVSEAVLGRSAAPFLDHELEPLELGEGRQQPRPGEEPLEQRQAEGAPDDGRGRD